MFLKGCGGTERKSQADTGACGTYGPEKGGRTRNSAFVGSYHVPKALEFVGLFVGEYGIRARDSKPPPEKGV